MVEILLSKGMVVSSLAGKDNTPLTNHAQTSVARKATA